MPFIQNCAAADIPSNFFKYRSPNTMLIQIVDPLIHTDKEPWFPVPVRQFKEVHKFTFFDVEKNNPSEFGKVTDEQAEKLVALLKHALENDMDVVVHCIAGKCRSGAVAEIGVILGFEDTGRHRQPNLLVKHKMMKALGWTYDDNEEPKPLIIVADNFKG